MKPEHFEEELSAYLDGESKNPDQMKRLIQKDPKVAKRFMEMQKLSTHLQELPGPVVRPEFLTRVMAHVREQEEEKRQAGFFALHFGNFSIPMHRWLWPRWALASFVTTLLVAVAVGTWMNGNSALPEGNEQNANIVPFDVAEFFSLTDDEVIERLEGFYGEEVEAYAALPEGEAVYVASAAWSDYGQYYDYGFSAQDDLYGMLNELNETEQEYFSTLLQEYAN